MKYPPHVKINSITDGIHWLNSVSNIKNPMFKAVSAVQSERPTVQIVALMAAAKCLCDAVGYDPVHLIRQLEQAASDMDSPFTYEWRALTTYAHQEFKVHGQVRTPE